MNNTTTRWEQEDPPSGAPVGGVKEHDLCEVELCWLYKS